jgi:hypothetical protein
MTLLRRCVLILPQNPINERNRGLQLAQTPLLRLARCWNCTRKRFADQSPMHAQLPRNPGNRAYTELMLTTYLGQTPYSTVKLREFFEQGKALPIGE